MFGFHFALKGRGVICETEDCDCKSRNWNHALNDWEKMLKYHDVERLRQQFSEQTLCLPGFAKFKPLDLSWTWNDLDLSDRLDFPSMHVGVLCKERKSWWESCRFGAQGSCDFLTCRTLDVFGAKSVPEGMYWMYSDVRDVRLVLDPWRWPGYLLNVFPLGLTSSHLITKATCDCKTVGHIS